MNEKIKCAATGKTRYESSHEAKEVLLNLKTSFKKIEGRRIKHRAKKVGQKRYYWCRECKGFHLTSISLFKDKITADKKISVKRKEFFDTFDITNWKNDSIPFPNEKIIKKMKELEVVKLKPNASSSNLVNWKEGVIIHIYHQWDEAVVEALNQDTGKFCRFVEYLNNLQHAYEE